LRLRLEFQVRNNLCNGLQIRYIPVRIRAAPLLKTTLKTRENKRFSRVFSCLDGFFRCAIPSTTARLFSPFFTFFQKLWGGYGEEIMGTLKKSAYAIPLPENATIKNGIVSWTDKGKKKTGKLSGTDKVRCESEIWIARFIDENGKRQEISTKTKDKASATRVLVKHENEVSLIQAGLAKRSDIEKTAKQSIPIHDFIEGYKTKLIASGCSKKHVVGTMQQINALVQECQIDTLSDLTSNTIDRWLAAEIEAGLRTPKTLNIYITAMKGLLNWCVDSKHLSENPILRTKKLNEAVGRKKHRRALTEDELKNLFAAAHVRK